MGSVSDATLLQHLFARYRPQIVFHAAAYKHVPLMECNPLAALDNNAVGTHTLANVAKSFAVQDFVLLSTDKAADPRSILGASKRIAELALLSLLSWGDSTPRAKVARLVNVYGSSGSVVPHFMQQISQGGPVTVTHPDAQRYFMSIAEAVDMLLAIAGPSIASGVYIPKVDAPIKILNLAEQLIASSAEPSTENSKASIQIVFTGLRPGDKLTETPWSTQESLQTSHCDASWMRVQSPCPPSEKFSAAMQALTAAIAQRHLADALHWVRTLVPEYDSPAEKASAELVDVQPQGCSA